MSICFQAITIWPQESITANLRHWHFLQASQRSDLSYGFLRRSPQNNNFSIYVSLLCPLAIQARSLPRVGRNCRCWLTPKTDTKCWSQSAGQAAFSEWVTFWVETFLQTSLPSISLYRLLYFFSALISHLLLHFNLHFLFMSYTFLQFNLSTVGHINLIIITSHWAYNILWQRELAKSNLCRVPDRYLKKVKTPWLFESCWIKDTAAIRCTKWHYVEILVLLKTDGNVSCT